MSPARPRTLRPVHTSQHPAHIHYYDAEGVERLIPAVHAAHVRFEDALPARDIPSRVGQRHTPGKLWSSTTGRMVGYESHLESKWMKLFDFDFEVVSFSAQPFTIDAVDGHGKWKHTPDLFARRRDGSALLLDVKADDRLAVPAVAQQAQRTEDLCAQLGWDYDMVGEPDPQLWATVQWLAGYRRPSEVVDHLAGQLMALAQEPVPLGDLVSFQPSPELARPVVFHLMWHHQLAFDPAHPLSDRTTVWAAEPRSNA
ncbi:TnsA-like heteromeric transposase endonuclease subunit [Streptomyces sp. NPDC051561]|uniref:TnsA-like heteromeric transposase endonuclease subunit n=1 Tax=Streptomyces sp. NPDC051561 TaxID=3365658 RepID=UPI00379D1D4E